MKFLLILLLACLLLSTALGESFSSGKMMNQCWRLFDRRKRSKGVDSWLFKLFSCSRTGCRGRQQPLSPKTRSRWKGGGHWPRCAQACSQGRHSRCKTDQPAQARPGIARQTRCSSSRKTRIITSGQQLKHLHFVILPFCSTLMINISVSIPCRWTSYNHSRVFVWKETKKTSHQIPSKFWECQKQIHRKNIIERTARSPLLAGHTKLHIFVLCVNTWNGRLVLCHKWYFLVCHPTKAPWPALTDWVRRELWALSPNKHMRFQRRKMNKPALTRQIIGVSEQEMPRESSASVVKGWIRPKWVACFNQQLP